MATTETASPQRVRADAWLVGAGASIGTGMVVAAFSPIVVIVGYETIGHRHQAAALERALA